MKIVAGLGLGLVSAALIACAAGRPQRSTGAPSGATPASDAMAPGMGGHAQIDALDQQIAADLAKLGLPTSEPATCAAAGCAAPSADMMGATPRVEDPTCKPGASETCASVCTLADAICDNAGKICTLASQLGGADAYANEKCARGTESCTKSRARCCGCQ